VRLVAWPYNTSDCFNDLTHWYAHDNKRIAWVLIRRTCCVEIHKSSINQQFYYFTFHLVKELLA